MQLKPGLGPFMLFSHKMDHAGHHGMHSKVEVEVKRSIAVRKTSSHHYVKSHALWDHTVLPATRQRWLSRLTPAEADTRFGNPRGMQGWVDLGGGYNSHDSLPTRRRSLVSEINNQAESWLGGELSTLESWVRRPNHSTTEPRLDIEQPSASCE